jgi:porin
MLVLGFRVFSRDLGGQVPSGQTPNFIKPNPMKPALTTLLLSTPLLAVEPSWLAGNHLTGDWKGLRTDLEESGVKYFGYYNAIFAANVSGGRDQDSNYAGDLFTGLEFDFEKLWGWDDTTFVVTAIDRHGSSIDPEVGGQYSVMQLVGGQNAFLYNVTLEKWFLDHTLSVKLGRMTATDDFVGSPLYSYSLNNCIDGQIRAALFDGTMTSYPFAVWGGRIKYQPSDDFYAMLGVFQLSDDMFDREDQGVDFSIEGDDGVSIFTQFGWNKEICGRPAHFYAGMNNAFWSLDKFNTNDTTNHLCRLYGHADWQVTAESADSDQGLTLFTAAGYTWQDQVAIMPLQITCGANYKGFFPGRDDDRTVLFATYGDFSGEYAAGQAAASQAQSDYEMVLEAGHRFQLTPFAYIQPDVQYIVQPGGTGNISDAVVVGAQFGVTF